MEKTRNAAVDNCINETHEKKRSNRNQIERKKRNKDKIVGIKCIHVN